MLSRAGSDEYEESPFRFLSRCYFFVNQFWIRQVSFQSKIMKTLYITLVLTLISAGCLQSQIPMSADEVAPLEVGQTIPDVTLLDGFNNEMDLQEMVSEKPTLLIFYRGGWCPYCNTHLSNLAMIEEELYDMGIQVLAVSPDKPEYLKESTMKHELDYKLLSDSDMNASKKFGLAYKVDSETINRYKNGGLDLAERSGHDHYLLPVPAAFLVDTEGIIQYRYFNPDYTVRVGNEALLDASKELVSM